MNAKQKKSVQIIIALALLIGIAHLLNVWIPLPEGRSSRFTLLRQTILTGKVDLAYNPKGDYCDMAMVFISEDGEKILDMFSGYGSEKDPYRFDKGSQIKWRRPLRPIPKIFGRHNSPPQSTGDPYPDIPPDRPNELFVYGQAARNVQLGLWKFGQDFPEMIDTANQLTFRPLNFKTYRFSGLPKGRGYVWFQSPFDGNRITQYPTLIEFDHEPGEITRIDIEVSAHVFYFL